MNERRRGNPARDLPYCPNEIFMSRPHNDDVESVPFNDWKSLL
jgi:hypothetical protein